VTSGSTQGGKNNKADEQWVKCEVMMFVSLKTRFRVMTRSRLWCCWVEEDSLKAKSAVDLYS